MEIQKEDAMELEKVKKGMVPSLEKTKFWRKATKDMKSISNVDEVMDSDIANYFFKLFYHFSNTANYFQVKKKKKNRGRPGRGRREAPDHKRKMWAMVELPYNPLKNANLRR